eukprot:scaffold10348_cov54-Attheya_sp.AAC.3
MEIVQSMLPGLFVLVGAHSSNISCLQSASKKAQMNQIGHLLLRALETVVVKTYENPTTAHASLSSTVKTSSSELMAGDDLVRAATFEPNSYIEAVRMVCHSDTVAGAAVYDLLLDVLLYQPTSPSANSNSTAMPPQGLSQIGQERLVSGASTTSKNWAAEFAPRARLAEIKMGILDVVAPCRRWAFFAGPTGNGDTAINNARDSNALGTARTVALLLATTGDSHPDVAERASSYLRAHMDSMRNITSTKDEKPSSDNTATNGDAGTSLSPLFGDVISLTCGLLGLVLGDTVANMAIKKYQDDKEDIQVSLGTGWPTVTNDSPLRMVALSTKRRMVTTKSCAAILNFVSSKLLDDIPRIFSSSRIADKATMSSPELSACRVGALAIVAANSQLSTPDQTSSTYLTNSRGSPRVAAARVLNSVCVRLTSMYDAMVQSNNDSHDSATIIRLHDLLSRALAIACSNLASASSPHSITTGNKANIDARDSCYGVICTLARSRIALAPSGMVFNCGGSPSTVASITSTASSNMPQIVSIATAALLFGCASNEEEMLKPRSVAALDALLGAYCKVYARQQVDLKSDETMIESSGSNELVQNPWAQQSTTNTEQVKNVKSTGANFDGVSRALFPLLWSSAQSHQPKASRLAAARWSNELMKSLDLSNACHLLCFLCGDTDVTTSMVARDGLGLSAHLGEEDTITSNDSETSLPDFNDLVSVLFEEEDAKAKPVSSWRPTFHDFSPSGRSAALRFGLTCLLSDLYGGEDNAVDAYVRALSETLQQYDGGRGSQLGREAIDLLDECCICLAGCLSTSQFARSKVVNESSKFGLATMTSLAISSTSSKARRYLAESAGYLYEDWSLWVDGDSQQSVFDFSAWVSRCGIEQTMSLCASKLTEMQTNLFMAGEVHGAAFLGSTCVRAFRLASLFETTSQEDCGSIPLCWNHAASILSALGRGCLHTDEAIGNACAKGISISFSYTGNDAPILDQRLYAGTASSLNELNAALRRYGNGDHTDPTRVSSLAEAVGVALAASTSGAGHKNDSDSKDSTLDLGPTRLLCVDSLFALLGSSSFRKDNEISLTVGEALVRYADAYSPKGALWTRPKEGLPTSFDESYATELPPHAHVLYVLLEKEIKTSSPHKRTACAPVLLALAGHASRLVHNDKLCVDRAFVTEILDNLEKLQVAFVKLLADPKSKQLSRESCCLGLAACRGISVAAGSTGNIDEETSRSGALNERLLKAFGETTNYGGSAMIETRAQETARRAREQQDSADSSGAASSGAAASLMEDYGMEAASTEVGGTSGLGEAALGAYREMASAAMSLGRPDILYSLMILSVAHPVWFTSGVRDRYSANSLLGKRATMKGGTNAAELREALRPHLASLIPRLLRACNDPNKQTREQMNVLWVALCGGGAESREAITEHLLTTIDTLIDDAINKLWRARVGACGALAEVIVGRSWEDLGGGGAVMDDDDVMSEKSGAVRLLRLWRIATRSLDDVRLTVRESGETLARSVRSLTIRLCDPLSGETKETETNDFESNTEKEAIRKQSEGEAAVAASTALRWLVKYGLNQACAEGAGMCVSCLLGIVDVARPSTLQPVLVRVSGDSASERDGVGGYDRLERMRLQMAQSGPIAGALTKCIDMMPHINLDSQKAVVPQLDTALRCGAGFATRAAAADAVTSLCSACPLAFKFPGSSTNNPTVRLLRALYFASERERGTAARDKMAHALGSLAALAPGQSVRSLSLRACERYSGAMGSNDDPAARRAAAAAIRSIAVRASDQFSDGGPGNVWLRKILPIAFLGQKDEDTKIASLWKEVWEEGGTTANLASGNDSSHLDDFGVTLHEKMLPSLVRACANALNDVSWSRRIAACSAIMDLTEMNVLAPPPRSTKLKSDSLFSQNEILRARSRAQASSSIIIASVKVIVKSRIWAGKSDVVKAAVGVVAKWVATSKDFKDNSGYLGWDVSNEGSNHCCPWTPVSKQNNEWNDLFIGDNWFSSDMMDVSDTDSPNEEKKIQEDLSNVELTSEKDDAALNFEDADKMLSEEPPKSEDESGLATKVSENSSPEILTLSGLCRALLVQATSTSSTDDEALPYKAAALQGLSDLLNAAAGSSEDDVDDLRYLYTMISPTLLSMISNVDSPSSTNGQSVKKQPPLLIARSFNCLASAMFDGIGVQSEEGGTLEETENIPKLLSILNEGCGGKQPAWTVREASAMAAAALASKAVRRTGNSKDGRSTLPYATNSQCSNAESDRQLMLEALLPHKEQIVKLTRAALRDAESKVTAVATDILSAISWWP